jgi:RNA-directed DNA polymerase
MADMRQQLEKFALWLHPKKTRLIEFGRFAAKDPESRGLGKPATFDSLTSAAGHAEAPSS